VVIATGRAAGGPRGTRLTYLTLRKWERGEVLEIARAWGGGSWARMALTQAVAGASCRRSYSAAGVLWISCDTGGRYDGVHTGAYYFSLLSPRLSGVAATTGRRLV